MLAQVSCRLVMKRLRQSGQICIENAQRPATQMDVMSLALIGNASAHKV